MHYILYQRCLGITIEHPQLQLLKTLVGFSPSELESATERHQSYLVLQSYPDVSCWNSLKISGIYSIRNLITNMQYIGQSTQIKNRWQSHMRELNKSRHSRTLLQQDWNLYGANTFEWLVIEAVPAEREQLLIRERYWMDAIEPGYNSTSTYARTYRQTKARS
ncbi:GIY-YIG nuclease family protein [Nostoc sp.]|uniref:GIY-YIG nuclease family protein n=1 Tax=Nostoc sp. TaxID=1180 RepID=UPI003593B1EA